MTTQYENRLKMIDACTTEFIDDRSCAASLTSLIKSGANINITSDDGDTLLVLLARRNGLYASKVLIDAGVDVNLADNSSDTALTYAARGGFIDLANLLIQSKSNINYVNDNKNSVFMIAVFNKSFQVAEALLTAGAIMGDADGDGQFVLHSCITTGGFDQVKFLLEHGADPHEVNVLGISALNQSKSRDYEDITALLEAHIEHQQILKALESLESRQGQPRSTRMNFR